jgi:hypothetical protein
VDVNDLHELESTCCSVDVNDLYELESTCCSVDVNDLYEWSAKPVLVSAAGPVQHHLLLQCLKAHLWLDVDSTTLTRLMHVLCCIIIAALQDNVRLEFDTAAPLMSCMSCASISAALLCRRSCGWTSTQQP